MPSALYRTARQLTVLSLMTVLAMGWSGGAHAQSREQLIERFREQCRAKFAHLRGPGQHEVVHAHVQPCVQAAMTAYVQGELQGMVKRIEGLIDAGKLKEAEAAARSGIIRAREIMREDRGPWAGGYGMLGRSLLFQGRLQEAEPAARQAIALHQRAGRSVNAAGAMTLLGAILSNQGRHEEADKALAQAMAILERSAGANDAQTGRTLLNYANLRLNQGRTQEAERLARRALAIHEAHDPRGSWSARSILAVGHAAFNAGRFADAEELLKQALAVGESSLGKQSWELSQILRFLGQVYHQTGRLAEAEPILRRAVDGFENTVGPEHRGTINAMRALAVVKTTLGDPPGAEALLRRALPFAQKVGGSVSTDNVSLTYLYLSLGEAVRLQGRTAEAEELLNAGLKAAEQLGKDTPYARDALIAVGRHHLAAGRLDDARQSFKRALDIAETTTPDGIAVASSLRWLAELELQGQHPTEALATLKRLTTVLDARRESARVLVGDRFNDDVTPLLHWVALASVRAAWQLEKGGGPIADEAFLGAQYESQSAAAAAITLTSSRFSAGNDALGELVRAGQDLLQRWHALDEQLTGTLQEGSAAVDARRALRSELDALSKDLMKVGTRIGAEFPQYAALAKPRRIGVAELQKLLRRDEVVVVYLVGDQHTFVWAISQDGFAWQQLPIDAKSLGNKVVRLRKGLDVGELQKAAEAGNVQLFDLALAHELYSDLVSPVAHAIQGKRNLVVVPSGPLTSLPFHLLVTDAPAKPITEPARIREYASAAWLINRHAISVVPAVASLRALREVSKRPQADKPLIAYGDPAFDPGTAPRVETVAQRKPISSRSPASLASYWKGATIDMTALAKGLEPLPETAEELRGVAQALGASPEDIHLGAAASETAVKAADLSRYRVVYFATHGLIAGEVSGLREPALALTIPATATETDNGLLTASEVALLKLNADWVVLSACNTAAGGRAGAEAFSGLARAFFYAGANTLLVSHWTVDSAAAVKLVTKTFEALKLDPDMSRAEALRRSMLAFMNDRSDPLYAYPAFWAPFTLVGDGG